jgi:hypothetical protein
LQADTEKLAIGREVDQWFFERYLPKWESLGNSAPQNPREILDYWNVPMHAASIHMNKWLLTEKAVLGLLDANHKPLQSSGYTHTNVIDRRTVVYNNNAASVDAIWSRCRHDNTEIERVAVHFEINRTDNGWRVIGLASVRTTKSSLKATWQES